MSKKSGEKEKKTHLTPTLSFVRRGGMPVRIMVFGTFDGLHPGHLNFFRQARSLVKLYNLTPSPSPGYWRGENAKSFLIVSIARDKNVYKIKGKYPEKNEKERMALVKESGLIDKVVLSGVRDHMPHIVKEKPDIIALGYDQKAYIKNLKKDLKERGLSVKIVRLKPYKENVYKNTLLRNHRA